MVYLLKSIKSIIFAIINYNLLCNYLFVVFFCFFPRGVRGVGVGGGYSDYEYADGKCSCMMQYGVKVKLTSLRADIVKYQMII